MSAAPQARPALVTASPIPGKERLRDAKSIFSALEHPEFKKLMQDALPRHLSPERMLRVFLLAVRKAPKLAEAPVSELVGAMLTLASLGLEPNTPLGHAYLIPFEAGPKDNRRVTIQVIIGYQGYLELARRTGQMVSIHADVVYKGDEFSFEYGTNTHLRHVPVGDSEGREPIFAYAHATLKDGQAFEVLPYAKVLRIRDGSQGYQAAVQSLENSKRSTKDAWKRKSYDASPWVAHEHEMASKSMIRRLSKRLPMSLEFANAAALDAMSEGGRIGFSGAADMLAGGTMDFTMLEHDPAETVDFGDQDAREMDPVEREQASSGPAAQQQQASASQQQGDPREEPPPLGEADQSASPAPAAAGRRRNLSE